MKKDNPKDVEKTEEELDEELAQWKKDKWCKDMHKFYQQVVEAALRIR